MAVTDGSLMLGFSAPIYRDSAGKDFIESQTISGLRAWRQQFPRIVAFAIRHDGAPPKGWEDAGAAGLAEAGIEVVPLPDTYDLKTYFKQRKAVSDLMLRLMRSTQYHSFGYGGWIGDPAEIAAATARRHRIGHAVWFDRVESQVVLSDAADTPLARLKSRLKSRVFVFNENRAVRHADLSLLHGATVFNHFKPIARNPHQVEDIHYTEADRIGAAGLAAKIADAAAGPLRILYCGRAAAMKGPLHWISALVALKRQGVTFTARWAGDGEMLPEMREAARAGGLDDADLRFEGFVADPEIVRSFYREAQVLLFCHLTNESPRNLIESLHSATPLVGYGDPYAEALVAEQSAGILVPRGSVDALVSTLAGLDRDRARLQELIGAAGASAAHLTREAVFHHRSEIIRNELGRTPS